MTAEAQAERALANWYAEHDPDEVVAALRALLAERLASEWAPGTLLILNAGNLDGATEHQVVYVRPTGVGNLQTVFSDETGEVHVHPDRLTPAKRPAHNSDDRNRIIQSNHVAGIVIDAVAVSDPELFVNLHMRYGIADALYAAGYRLVAPAEK